MTPMNVLIACEESQRVCIAFRNKGHNVFSCDLLPCSGGHPEWHIQGDCVPLLDGSCEFKTMDGVTHSVEKQWDMIIAFPPCTFLTNTGNRWFNFERYGNEAVKRWIDRCKAIVFFMKIACANCDKIVIENPIGVMSTVFRKPDQIVHPWMFAQDQDEETEKATCLWLKGVPKLAAVHLVKPSIKYHEWVTDDGKKKRQTLWYYKTRCMRPVERARYASKTPTGLAQAMADQWG